MEIAPLAQLQQTQKLLEYVNRLLPEIMKEVSVFLQTLSTAVVSCGDIDWLFAFVRNNFKNCGKGSTFIIIIAV